MGLDSTDVYYFSKWPVKFWYIICMLIIIPIPFYDLLIHTRTSNKVLIFKPFIFCSWFLLVSFLLVNYLFPSHSFFSNGEKWKSRRRLITPTFHFKILDEFIQVFEKQSTTLVSVLMVRKTYFLFVTSVVLDSFSSWYKGHRDWQHFHFTFPFPSEIQNSSYLSCF